MRRIVKMPPFIAHILDKAGRPYALSYSSQGSWDLIQLYDGQYLVGEAKLESTSTKTFTAFLIKDIAIANQAKPPAPYTNYRNKGLGSALLTWLSLHVQAQGAQALTGDVYQQDIENTPHLLDWYQKQGFAIQPPRPNMGPDVIAQIYKPLV
jgi:hypothetical protein